MLNSWQPLHVTVSELRSECSDFESMVEGFFEELNDLRGELASRIAEVSEQLQRLRDRESLLEGDREEATRLTHELEQREARLEAAMAELEETRQQLAARQQSDADEGTAQQAELQGRIDQLLEEKSELRQRLDESEDDLQRLADAEAELSETRQQLQEARHQLDQQSLAVDVAQADGVPLEVVNELREERDALEAELELVRSQAAELNETISEQQRQLDTQKTEITGEVSELRRMFEQQAQLLTERTIARETVAVGAPAPRAAETAAEDPVVTSVMAQFAKLQRDVAQRRRRKA